MPWSINAKKIFCIQTLLLIAFGNRPTFSLSATKSVYLRKTNQASLSLFFTWILKTYKEMIGYSVKNWLNNLLKPVHAWSAQNHLILTIMVIFLQHFQKIFEGEVYFRINLTTPLQIFCKFLNNFWVIFKSKIGSDNGLGKWGHEWTELFF